MPPPLPKSSTTSPECSSASAVGLPHPSEASAAFSGTPSRSSTWYKLWVIVEPDALAQQPLSQQLDRAPFNTSLAMVPYRSFTTCVMSTSAVSATVAVALLQHPLPQHPLALTGMTSSPAGIA